MNMTDIIDGIAARAAVSTAAETDYTDSDGLKRCGVCNELKECRVEFNGFPRTVPCLCSCGLREREERKRELKRRENEDMRRNWVRGYEDMTFDNSTGNPTMQFAEKYLKNWERIRENGISVTLSGNVGCGKTYAAAAIANRLITNGFRAWVATTSAMLDMMFEDASKLHSRLATFDLVVIDDFGAERNTEFAAEKMFQIIDERYRSHLPTIITTNLDINQPAPDVTYKRIYSRIQGFAPQFRCKGEDLRKDAGAETRRLVWDILKGE